MLRASLTWDQGPEMGKWKQVAIDADIDIYFCDPHAPWQRATNENTNGLLQQYFPKSSDLSAHSAEDLDWVAAELNDRSLSSSTSRREVLERHRDRVCRGPRVTSHQKIALGRSISGVTRDYTDVDPAQHGRPYGSNWFELAQHDSKSQPPNEAQFTTDTPTRRPRPGAA
jgi:hypothetical protein